MGSFCRRFYPLSTQSSVWVLACSSSPSTLAPLLEKPPTNTLRSASSIHYFRESRVVLQTVRTQRRPRSGRREKCRAACADMSVQGHCVQFAHLCAPHSVHFDLLSRAGSREAVTYINTSVAAAEESGRAGTTAMPQDSKSYVTCCRTLNLAYVTKLSVNFERATAQAVFWVSGFSAPLETQQSFYCFDHGRGISYKMTAPFLILPPFSAPILHGRRLTPS